MKKITIISLLFMAGCTDSAVRKFKYNDSVKVVSGFYQGCTGIVAGEGINNKTYFVDLECVKSDIITSYFQALIKSKDMELK